MNDETLKGVLSDFDDDDNANFLKVVKNVGYADPALELEMMDEVLLQYQGTGKRVVISKSNVIGSYAFADNETLEEIVFGPQVRKISDNAFVNCINLRSIKFEKEGDRGILCIAAAAFSGCESLRTVDLPDTLKTIGEVAFTGCSRLWRIEIPDSVVSIGEAAFAGCGEVAVKKLPKDLKVVEKGAFSQVAFVCDLPEGVTSIEEYAFEYSHMNSFYIPKSVKHIGKNSFPTIELYDDEEDDEEDDEDGYVLFGGTEEEWNKIEIDKTGGWLESYKIKFNCKRRK